jgi:hypothetical protein
MSWRLAAALAALSACGPFDVVVAFDPDGGRGPPCTSPADCPPDAFCERQGCDPGATGRCQHRPVFCERTLAPVCDCDDVTHLNDCWRRATGASVQSAGECRFPKTCDSSHPCSAGASCARLTATCGGGDGVCWVAPPSCPGAQAFVDCADPGICLDACAAIASGRTFKAAGNLSCP